MRARSKPNGPKLSRSRRSARPLPALLREKWLLFVLALSSSLVTFLVQRQSGAVVSLAVVAPLRRACNALISYWRYVGLN